ncbi:MAG TPA: ureidoglycolate lyase, partial [Rhodothermales bacterium]
MTTTRIKSQRISCDNFAAYGTVAQLGAEAPLAQTSQFSFWSDHAAYRIEGETEIGFCTVRAPKDDAVDWMERHERTPEVLIPIDWPVVLPVMREDGTVEAFEMHPGEAVVIGQNVWHSACLPLGRREATYFVVFRRGTPHEDVVKQEIETV